MMNDLELIFLRVEILLESIALKFSAG